MTLPIIMIGQGDVFASADPCVVSTVLGSCVAVCLHDRCRRAGGVTHFVLPTAPADGRPDNRCGNHAIAALIERMAALGCAPDDLCAKIFGGAVPDGLRPGSPFAVGSANVALARELLARHAIPLTADRTGGPRGMKIRFETATGRVHLHRLGGPEAGG